MAITLLLSSVLMGLVLLVIVAAVLQGRNWRRAAPREASRSTYEALSAALRDPTAWTVVFLVLAGVATVGTLAVVGALPIEPATQALVGSVLLVLAAAALAGFVFLGVYAAVRDRGYGTAPAVGAGTVTLGLLVLLVVIVQLFVG